MKINHAIAPLKKCEKIKNNVIFLSYIVYLSYICKKE